MGRLVRSLAAVLTPGLLVLVTACSGSFSSSWGSGSAGSNWSAVSSSSRVVSSTAVAGSGRLSAVSCSGSTCSVTLGGAGARAHVLGSTIAFGAITDGRATLRVGGGDVMLARGDEVTTDSLRLVCTDVTRDTVALAVERR
jgi:hypothetical protein